MQGQENFDFMCVFEDDNKRFNSLLIVKWLSEDLLYSLIQFVSFVSTGNEKIYIFHSLSNILYDRCRTFSVNVIVIVFFKVSSSVFL